VLGTYPREPRDPPRSFADLSALLLVADQVQSIVDQKNDAINVTAKTPSPFVISPIRSVAEPLFRVPVGCLPSYSETTTWYVPSKGPNVCLKSKGRAATCGLNSSAATTIVRYLRFLSSAIAAR
jgi:hypothetical protein